MTRPQPGGGRYAHLEREQRWLLRVVPPAAIREASITDRYITGTRLRLRHSVHDAETAYKLGQKVRIDAARAERVMLTNVYLSAQEYTVLAQLPAAELRKTRWRIAHGDRELAVDEFHDGLQGLVLAEVELSADDDRLPSPPWAIRDVTDDDRFSGGALAVATVNPDERS